LTDTNEAPRCPDCDVVLVRLGGAVVRVGGRSFEVEHWICPRCGKRRRRHSEGGWKDTDVDLTAG